MITRVFCFYSLVFETESPLVVSGLVYQELRMRVYGGTQEELEIITWSRVGKHDIEMRLDSSARRTAQHGLK
ncbi:hypothetical protein MHYP_G00322000 [Metynnis hypsauchen]